MRWFNFIILNCVAPIANLHQVSDAGAGAGVMQLHPIRDSEFIACGQANTPVNGADQPSPLLDNGSVTPAILVHAILLALQERGFKIRLHCYQLGLDNLPDFTGSRLDEVVVKQCALGEEGKLIHDVLLPELERQARCGEQHLIAESGIGGTTLATLWLRRWLDGKLSVAGSSKDPDKLAVKAQLLEKLQQQTDPLPLQVCAYTASHRYSDPLQRACCALLASDLEKINFAGGAMIFAPVIAMGEAIKVKRLSIATTRWAMDSPGAQLAAASLPENCTLYTPAVQFAQSSFPALRMYEQGYVVEGCGLGAALCVAERHGITGSVLLNSLDKAVAVWVN